MKRLTGIIGVFASVALLYSCSEDDTNLIDDNNSSPVTAVTEFEISQEDANTSVTTDAALEDIDIISEVNFAATQSNGRSIEDPKLTESGPEDHAYGEEVAITKEENEDGSVTTTIDFGEGVTGRRGLVRAGQIVITKSGDRKTVGSTKTISFVDYSFDGIAVEGTRTVEVTAVSDTEITHAISMTGSLTFEDGTIVTRTADRTRVMTLEDGKVVQTAKFGTATGVNKDGLAYTYSVVEEDPIVHTRACRDSEDRIYAPVSGTRTIAIEGESDKVIDYGDGECDNLAVVTIDDVSEEITVDPRHRKRKFKRATRK
ncbi:hypothetical protein [Reichenbachiella versicolor]|uniref:hypothetical protein n=1 Tax=Reichenbachiella versicolor TaxID=1821036 RepID=UPI000D6E57D0|nr:hypothetical protein [Reichenbachiella versicolor]